MTTLKFVDSHNMVTFFTKSAESEGFEQIVDFLNVSSIRYALTVNPIIYTLCIEQFWATVKAKTVNGEVQLQALEDRKKIIITKSIVKRDLQLEDAEGIDCLSNATIFEQLSLMGSASVVSSDEASLGDQEDASKQGRKTNDIDADEEITLFDETQGRFNDEEIFDMDTLTRDEVVTEQGVPDNKKDDVAQVNTAAIIVSTADTIPVSVASIIDVEITLAQALAEFKSAKPATVASTRPKAKELVIHEEEQATTPTVSSQQPSKAKIQDKKWNDIQAKIKADQLLAERLQAREQEE
ncbi:hypothetical protein Tco_0520585 [Tanacetum coccineum]